MGDWCRKEIEMAQKYGKGIVALIEDGEMDLRGVGERIERAFEEKRIDIYKDYEEEACKRLDKMLRNEGILRRRKRFESLGKSSKALNIGKKKKENVSGDVDKRIIEALKTLGHEIEQDSKDIEKADLFLIDGTEEYNVEELIEAERLEMKIVVVIN